MSEKPRTFFNRLVDVMMWIFLGVCLHYFIEAFFIAFVEGP